jgi:hypothetical protein
VAVDLVLEPVEQLLAAVDPVLDLPASNQRRIFSRSWAISSASSKV